MMATVISVPSMGAARILLIPGVIQAPQQRNRRHRGKAGRGGAARCLRAHRVVHTASGRQEPPLFVEILSDARPRGRTERFVCLGATRSSNVHNSCFTSRVLSQQYDSSIQTKKDRNNLNFFSSSGCQSGAVQRFALIARRLCV